MRKKGGVVRLSVRQISSEHDFVFCVRYAPYVYYPLGLTMLQMLHSAVQIKVNRSRQSMTSRVE